MRQKNKKQNFIRQGGFTLIELLVTISLMAIINGLILASVPGINKRIGLKRTTGEIAMLVRQAQAYALGIKQFNNDFPGYGVHFDKRVAANKSIILFADLDIANDKYDSGEEVQEYKINTGDIVSGLCAGDSGACEGENNTDKIDIVFNRASPFSKITGDNTSYSFAKITIKSPREENNNTKEIQIWSSGQIEIK